MIDHIFTTSLLIWGINCLFSEGFILYKTGKSIEKIFGSIVVKPIFKCHACMASVWGTAYYFILVQDSFIYWPVFCLSVCGLNFIIGQAFGILDDILTLLEDVFQKEEEP